MRRRKDISGTPIGHRSQGHAREMSSGGHGIWPAGKPRQVPVFFLFHIPDTDIYAFSMEKTGANIPYHDGGTWHYVEVIRDPEFLGGEMPLEFDEVLMHLAAHGWFGFRAELRT